MPDRYRRLVVQLELAGHVDARSPGGRALLTAVGELSTTGSRLSFDYDEFVADSILSKLRTTPGMQEVASMWEGGLSENPVEWMRAHGWLVATRDRAAFARSYGRRLADTTGGFIEATRL